MVQFITILHTTLRGQKQKRNQTSNSQQTPHNSPSRVRYGVSIMRNLKKHYDDVIIITMTSQITSLTVVYSIVYSDADQRKHQSSVSLAFVWGIHRDRWIPHTKGQLRGKCFHLMTSSLLTALWPHRTVFSSLSKQEVVISAQPATKISPIGHFRFGLTQDTPFLTMYFKSNKTIDLLPKWMQNVE